MPKLDLDNVEKVYTNVQNYKCVSKFKLLDDILIIIQMILFQRIGEPSAYILWNMYTTLRQNVYELYNFYIN